MNAARIDELGFYTLAGHTNSPRDLIRQLADAERIGLGAAFISERWNLTPSELAPVVAAHSALV